MLHSKNQELPPEPPSTGIFSKVLSVQMGGVLQYKLEVYCGVSLSSGLEASEAQRYKWVTLGCTAVQIGGVLPVLLRQVVWADVRTDIRADVPAQKLSPHRPERRKIKFFCADVLDPKAQTSMTRGGLRKITCGTLRADFRSLFPAKKRCQEHNGKQYQGQEKRNSLHLFGKVPNTVSESTQRRRDDIKNKICGYFFGGGGGNWGQRGKSSKTIFFFRGKRHDNKILKVHILLSRNFVVIAQAPKYGFKHRTQ